MGNILNDDKEGPTHYEGWTCKGCKYFKCYFENRIEDFKCCANLNDEYPKSIIDPMNTPNWCPFIKGAIVMHVLEECS